MRFPVSCYAELDSGSYSKREKISLIVTHIVAHEAKALESSLPALSPILGYSAPSPKVSYVGCLLDSGTSRAVHQNRG